MSGVATLGGAGVSPAAGASAGSDWCLGLKETRGSFCEGLWDPQPTGDTILFQHAYSEVWKEIGSMWLPSFLTA